ncbi:MAG: undecaprenyldiphospho-muramoylpentapeptide beta-N-acetylglucosaminyltransferase [Propionibacteriaceae bacterium]|jgi:UDP-N-acetylglucosamine--N-acetylmuramyl-(pentapeptide) pyrophosphoryl-undecaprenol N-acetylglucosamine transferase|nr:undecaprenyldiphospho-muramoylpentapeptide beta-N-acetylglucosaminyltransferase [Propionibacteriaceae bacterium]
MPSIVMAGGGTAGHTSPLLATAEQLTGTITCIGTAKGLETRVIPAAGLPLELIPPVPLPRKLTPELFSVPLRLRDAVGQAADILRAVSADVVAGFGGYVSLPAYLAARKLKLPVVIHEQNAIPGLANRVAARFAAKVAVTFAATKLPGAVHVGLPVRQAIASLDRVAAQPRAREFFGLPVSGPVLLVSGGSQGARSLNRATVAAAPALLRTGVSVLHVLGQNNFTADCVPIEGDNARYLPVAYVDGMENAYAAADLMLGRSGAGTVMETAMVGLPAIFVPLPHGNGEQARNASFLIEAGAGLLVADADLTPELLAEQAAALLGDPARLQRMSAKARELVPADAAVRLARLIEAVI